MADSIFPDGQEHNDFCSLADSIYPDSRGYSDLVHLFADSIFPDG